MGCCESKLLNSPEPFAPIQPSLLNQDNQQYPVQIKLVQIGLHNQFSNTDRNSLQSLQLDLEAALQNFQSSKDPLAFTILQYKNHPKLQLNQSAYNQKKKEAEKSHNIQNLSKDIFTDTDFSQQSYSKEESQQLSLLCQTNTKILENASINTKKALQKQLFYINSCKIGQTTLLKWNEKQRLPINFQYDSLVNELKEQKSLIFVAAILLTHLFEKTNKLKLLAIRNEENRRGIRLFVNGTKRMLEIKSNTNQQKGLLEQLASFLSFLNSAQLSYWIYCLSGWIPQTINLTHFPDSNEILKRVIKNFQFANILIAFTNQLSTQFLLLKSICAEMQTATLAKIFKQQSQNKVEHDLTLSWTQLSQQYPFLNVNWNPMIYGFSKKLESLNICQEEEESQSLYKSAFILDIPPSKSEVQIRIIVQRHIQFIQDATNNLSMKLYESEGNIFDFAQKVPIKQTHSKNGKFISQIFIFEKSVQKSQYILTVESNYEFPNENLQISLDLFSFCLIKVKKLAKPVLLETKTISSQLVPENAGFGMNSPFFINNLHYSLSFDREIHCRIRARIQSVQPAIFQLCILPDQHNYRDITLIKPQHMIKGIIQSQQFQNEGVLEFIPVRSSYILILVCFTPCFGNLTIQIQNYQLNPQETQNPNLQCLIVQKITECKQFQRQQHFTWKDSSPGPRKRTKQNCLTNFCAISTFEAFFKNPSFDLELSQGYYQLSISSMSFLNSLQILRCGFLQSNRQQCCAKLLSASPPSLSMGIYELNNDKSEARIILDDYQYIPYGIGFWTSAIKLHGTYRFIFSKLEKGQQQGIFRIRKLNI